MGQNVLLVKTKIGYSKINGIGVFAAEFIPKGTIIWKYVLGFDQKLTQEQLDRFPKITKEFLEKYTYFNKYTNFYVLCCDDARFYNHSKAPNTMGADMDGTEDEGADIAAKDIEIGEEITCDYEKEWDEDISSWNL